MAPYNELQSLDTYPATTRGNMVMDAGVIEFTKGSYVEVAHSMGFKNNDIYCVAPIAVIPKATSAMAAAPANSTTAATGNATSSDTPTAGVAPRVYDFWAVGINCCSGQFPDFHCGEFADQHARSGLRFVGDDVKAYFRLAVAQAEATFKIQTKQPLFVQWLRDPKHEVDAYMEAANTFWATGLLVFLLGQLVLVIVATVAFSKFGT